MTIFPHHGFGNNVLGDSQRTFLNATGDPAPGSIADAWAKYFSSNSSNSSSLLQNKTALTTLSDDAKKDYSWLTSALGILNSGVTGYFNTEAAKASSTLSAEEILNTVLAGTAAAQAKAKQEAQAKQTQTIIIGAVVGLVLLVGAYFVFRKK